MTYCENCLTLDVRRWSRSGRLRPGSAFTETWKITPDQCASVDVRIFGDHAKVTYMLTDAQAAVEQRLQIVWTPCHLGGSRKWFLCPGQKGRSCGRRVAILYLAIDVFCCRHCLGLKYLSQSESPRLRGIARAQKVRMMLGGTGSLMEPFPIKPRGMHWNTYRRLKTKALAREKCL
jgi:hypothetical protein